MSDNIQIPTPKYKPGDRLWYVRDKDGVFPRAYVCSWKMVIWSFGQSMIYYTVEYDDPDADEEDPCGPGYDVAENRLYDNELDARRKQQELLITEYKRQHKIMEELEKKDAEIMHRILALKDKEPNHDN